MNRLPLLPELAADVPGRRWVEASWWGTAVFTVTAVAAAIAPDVASLPALVVDLTLFALGSGAFLWAYAISIERSRYEILSVAGIYFLAGGAAPRDVRVHMMSALTVQVVVALATAGVRPFTELAFGILVPMYGLGMAGRWAAEHGQYAKGRLDEIPRKPIKDDDDG